MPKTTRVSEQPVPAKRKAAAKKTAAKKPAEKKPRTRKPKPQYECICGCGGMTQRYFVPGHDARFHGWLTKIRTGKNAPKDLMPAALVRNLGPWKDSGDGGKVPSKRYQDLRPEVK